MTFDPDTISDEALNQRISDGIDADTLPVKVMIADAQRLTLENQIGFLSADSTHDDIALAIDRLTAEEERVKKVRDMLEAVLMAWCKEHGEIVIGTVKYWFGRKKGTPKCLDKVKTFDLCLGLVGGSTEDVVKEFFASQPFKHGAIRKLVAPEVYTQHFQVEEKDVLEEKQLQKVDTRFIE